MISFDLERRMIIKHSRLEEIVARHNHLSALFPKEITEANYDDARLAQAEMMVNMESLLALLTELEQDCACSQFMRCDHD